MTDDTRVCDHCGDQITGGYAVHEHGDYHTECVQDAQEGILTHVQNLDLPYRDIAGVVVLLTVFVLGLALLWNGLPTALGSGEEYALQQAICHDNLGDEWEPAGVAKHDDWTHYHVQCERSTGLVGVEEQWVTIPADDYSIITI